MDKEKILLINPKYKNKAIVYFPLGLGYIASACNNQGIGVECMDMNLSNLNNYQILDIIRKNKYHIVGIGGFAMQLRSSIELINFIKENCKDVTVILGGVQVWGCEQFFMDNSKADVICIGESEIILPDLVHAIYAGKDFSHISSIIYRKNDKCVQNDGISFVENINKIPIPEYNVFQMESYIKGNYHSVPNKRTIDFLCSRGCPYKCNYCINSKKPVKVRYRSPENILSEIRFLKNHYGINDFSFCDENFTINKKMAFEICKVIQNENITWVTSCRADNIDEEILLVMKKAGCRMLIIGFESGSEKILKSMNKRVKLETYSYAITLLRKHGILFYANFMIGMPDETEETIRETEKFCIANNLIFSSSYVTPFPGTQLYDEVRSQITDEKKYLYNLGDMDFSKEPIINLTQMPVKMLVFFRNRAIVNTMTSIIHKKLSIIPIFMIKAGCWLYLSVFNIKNPIVAKILRPITKLLYRTFARKRTI